MKNSAIIYEQFYKGVQVLPPDQKAEAYDAYCELAIYGKPYEGDNLAISVLLSALSGAIEKSNENYQKKVDTMRKNRESKKSCDITRHLQASQDISESSQKSQETCTDTVTDKDKNIKKGATHPKKSAPITAGSEEQYVDDKELNDAICQFIVHRKALKKPMSPGAVKIFIGKLEKLSPGNTQGKIDLINEAIEHGWQTVYTHDDGKFKPKAKPPDKVTFNNNFSQRDYDYDALERQLLGVK